MAVLDTAVLTEIQLALIEDATFSSALWTLPEVIGYLNDRQYRFLQETRLVAAWTTIPTVPGQPEYDLPVDWIDTIAALWHDFTRHIYTPLPASDSFEMDHADGLLLATTVNRPGVYRKSDLETRRITLGPAPTAPGEIELIYIALSELLTGLGIAFEIPDDWTPYIKYGVLADMLGKDGRGQDLRRAQYAELRFQEGIALAQAVFEGWA